MDPFKTMIIGAHGLVGSAFLRAYRNVCPDTIGTHYSEIDALRKFDLLNPDFPELFKDQGFSSAIIAAGVPNILRCHKEPSLTYQCNVEGTLRLVEQLCKWKIAPVLFSTDYVFDGVSGGYVEDSCVNPLNEYGRQKAELERQVATHFRNECLVVRLSKVYGIQKGDRTLIDEMASGLVNQVKIRAAFDQIFCPVFIEDVVNSVARLQKMGATGIYHICGDEAISRLDLARAVCKALRAKDELIEPISLKDLSEPFARPQRTDMSNRKFCEKTGIQMQSLGRAIQLIVDQYVQREKDESQ
jgi:dTDP-4-dehydrorhamnose reductase